MTTTRTRTRRGALALCAVVVAGGVLAGCSDPVPTPGAAATAAATSPDLTVDQETALIEKVGSVLDVADRKRDGKALSTRLSGPALAMRTAELSVAKDRKSDSDVTDLPTTVQTVVVPTDAGWPRTTLAVSAQPSKDEPPRLMVLTQDDARSDYTLWAWARLFPGTTMPTFAPASEGTETVAASDTDTLVVSPTDAVNRYLDVLEKGSSSKYAKQYATDAFRTSIRSTTKAWTTNKDFKAADGEYTVSFKAARSPVALRTADGGALVVADVTETEKTSAEKGAKITPPNAAQKALLGDAKTTNRLTVTYRAVVAVHVPAKGATGDAAKVTVLGVEQVPVTVRAG